MSNVAHLETPMSPAEYLAAEAEAAFKSEYVAGFLYAMAGGSKRHNQISVALVGSLFPQVKRPCQVYAADFKVRIEHDQQTFFYYPDVFVSCRDDKENRHFDDGPVVIAEILSPTTGRSDRLEKFENYKTLATLQNYLLISQDIPRIEIFRRKAGWRSEVHIIGDTIALDGVAAQVVVSEIYSRVDF